MQNNLQPPNYSHPPPARRPSPYDQQDQQSNNPYAPKRRPLPSDSLIKTQQPALPKQSATPDPYSFAFELLQGTTRTAIFFAAATDIFPT
jgi:hypothetical protein